MFYGITGKIVHKSGGIYFYYTLATHNILASYRESDVFINKDKIHWEAKIGLPPQIRNYSRYSMT